MSNLLKYKDYFTKIEYSAKDKVLFGRIEGISDLVLFESEKAEEIEEEFHKAVDDYLLTCAEINAEPKVPFKGTFNIRISPELHEKAFICAAEKGISLNKLVAKSIEYFLDSGDDFPSSDESHHGKLKLVK